ncbi:MAG: V-type ATP synthase subunit D [Candidatus Hermodarchaeota archaeon]|nr:V-type ATP synthase subunit D [Candidatus Hermodarchaeota archaeon]
MSESAGIIAGVRPTRMELLTLKERRELAARGYELLREKQDALVREFFAILSEAKKYREEMETTLTEAFASFMEAKLVEGGAKLEELALGAKSPIDFDVETRNMMGVNVPIFRVTQQEEEAQLHYSLAGTSAAVDKAAQKVRTALEKIVRLAEIEATVKRLAAEIEKTKRRVNALNYVVLPRINNTIRYIELMLEEQEREDLFRMKRVKAMLERKASS